MSLKFWCKVSGPAARTLSMYWNLTDQSNLARPDWGIHTHTTLHHSLTYTHSLSHIPTHTHTLTDDCHSSRRTHHGQTPMVLGDSDSPKSQPRHSSDDHENG